MKTTALFPGSFDPITVGHTDIIDRALPLFDNLVVGIGNNQKKNYLFDLEQRKNWIQQIYQNNSQVSVKAYSGMTIHFCQKIGAQYMVRGIRNTNDFEYEKTVGQLNQSMNADIETIVLFSKPSLSHISSTIVREIIVNEGDCQEFVPQPVYESL